ncbi:MAG: hypothetical protein OCC49_14125 [Fibrobacterales bacterium]
MIDPTPAVQQFCSVIFNALKLPSNIQEVAQEILPKLFEFEEVTPKNKYPYLNWFQFIFDSLRPTESFEKEYCITQSVGQLNDPIALESLAHEIKQHIEKRTLDGTLSQVDSHHLSQSLYSTFFVLKIQMYKDQNTLHELDLSSFLQREENK